LPGLSIMNNLLSMVSAMHYITIYHISKYLYFSRIKQNLRKTLL